MRRTRVLVLGGLIGLLTSVTPAMAMAVTAATPGPPLPVSAVIASGDDGNVATNTLDGNLATRWSDEGDGVWIQYDLGTTRTVGSVSLAWHQGGTRTSSFEIRLSTNASTWTTVVPRRSSSGTTTQPENNDFTDASARYVRVVGYGNPVNDWTSITETLVLGADGTGGGTCRYPADVLNLTNWYLGLPIGPSESPPTSSSRSWPPTRSTRGS